MRNSNRKNIRGQVTIFIIIAIIIVALVAGYLVLKSSIVTKNIPENIQPAYSSFLTCLQQDTQTGIGILETQGGYIQLPAFEAGNTYMPFSSQLNFAGTPIPYWYYVSGNNIPKKQIPSSSDMEKQLGNFINSKIRGCNLKDYYDQGFVITMGNPSASVSINGGSVDVNLDMQMTIKKDNDTAVINTHEISQSSQLGNLYSSAVTVYDEEQKNLFLEKYGIDVLRLYAPVDGVEITCSPLTWDSEKVFDSLQEAIAANTLALKSKGNNTDYFALHLPVNQDVRFLNSPTWSNSLEISPADSRILVATPVGNQQGLGILGFCYVPYHFVYNIKYPVLVQVYNNNEIFQFPLAVVIQGNNPRISLDANASADANPEVCRYKNTNITINTYDRNHVPVNANISYQCLGQECSIGSTSSGTLVSGFPQCGNGFVSATSNGFKPTRYLFSTVQSGSLDMILDKVYPTNIQLFLDGKPYNGNATISFNSDYLTEILVYPEQRTINLGEGQHDIQVQIYQNSQIKMGATTKQQCVTVPQGILGVFGLTTQKCFDIQVPEQVISNALAGGGNQSLYMLESDLAKGKTLTIDAKSLPTPQTLEDIQNNYLLFDQNDLDIGFK